MFNPTKSHLLANFKLHHPLPLNPRESQQLLNLLTTSFRQHLDAEHPAFRKLPSTSASSRRRSSHHNDAPRKKSIIEGSRIPVDRHINSLLTNPLFGYGTSANASMDSTDTSARAMIVFDLALSKGLMTREMATTLLKTNMRTIKASSALDVQAELRKSGAGRKVLKWLVSSGEIDKMDFLCDEAFSTILIEHLVAENLQEVVWTWIKTGLDQVRSIDTAEGQLDRSSRRQIVHPLLQLVIAEANASRSLASAYMCISRAAGYLSGLPASVMRDYLYPPGRFLVNATISSHSTRDAVSKSDFESFYSLLPVVFSKPVYDRYAAHMLLFHPIPKVEPAFQFLSNLDESRTGRVYTRDVVQLGLDTAKHLLEIDEVAEALKIMDILRLRFPRELGVSQRRQLDDIRSEASTMELLEGLSLA